MKVCVIVVYVGISFTYIINRNDLRELFKLYP